MCALKLNVINDETPHLINALDTCVKHPSIQKYSYIVSILPKQMKILIETHFYVDKNNTKS